MAEEGQVVDLPELVLEEIFVRLPAEDFHRCRCLSRFWAATLSSHGAIDRHLNLRRKIRLDYHDLMVKLVYGCWVTLGTQTQVEQEEVDEEVVGEEEEEEEEEETRGLADWRLEYRRKGYVEVDEDYYIKKAEQQAVMEKFWAELLLDLSGPSASSGDEGGYEMLQACTVPYGHIHPRIRDPFIQQAQLQQQDQEEEEEEDDLPSMVAARGQSRCRGEKTEEEIDQEIIAFLVRCHNMDPRPKFMREFDSYRLP